ncbi:MAG TPA: hypothetical protein VG755_33015 [Nannocystaceae bacterium]|nr:hypothetical protein [Nannocystaceae bacterium]
MTSASEPIETWTTAWGDRIVVREAEGTLWCDPLVGQLLDAGAPTRIDPAGALRPSRHYLLDIDGRDHLVLVASRGDVPIALARCVRIAGTRVGVTSLCVRGDLRERGIEERMLRVLGELARTRDFDRCGPPVAARGRDACECPAW